MFDFTGRVVLITGAGSEKGIGRATALAFADQGADLVIADLNFEGAKDTCALIEAKGRKALPIHWT